MKQISCGLSLFLAMSVANADPTAAPVADPTEVATGFVRLLEQGKFEEAEAGMDANMRVAMPAGKLREIWSQIEGQAGAFQSQLKTRVQKIQDHGQDYNVVFVTCQFERTPLDVKVALDTSGKVAGLFLLPVQADPALVPAYVDKAAFHEVEVTVGSGEWVLPGTLTLPQGAGPFPAVVLVHGSGPEDRDETIGPNRPFRDLAWGLASKGVAVLRYDKRTLKYAAKIAKFTGPFTVNDETVDDAVAAVALLRTRPELDKKRLFVLGHSLGGYLAPRIGQRSPELAGLIVLAGSVRPMEDLMIEQLDYIASLNSKPSEEEKKQTSAMIEEAKRIQKLQEADRSTTAPILGAPVDYWLDLHAYHPTEVAQKLTQRMLFVQGERDYQVTMQDFALWKAALGSRPDVQFESYPKLNHLFMAGEGKAVPAEYSKQGFVDAAVVERLAKWVQGP